MNHADIWNALHSHAHGRVGDSVVNSVSENPDVAAVAAESNACPECEFILLGK